jgi:hypothetical protein
MVRSKTEHMVRDEPAIIFWALKMLGEEFRKKVKIFVGEGKSCVIAKTNHSPPP